VSILLLSKDRKMLEMSAFAGYSEEAHNIRIPVSSSITGWVVQNRQPLRVGDVSADPRYIQFSPEVRSELAVPLIYRGEVLGVLNVESDRPNAYSESDEEMLSTLAGSLAAIIANARLLEQLRRQMERQRLLLDITSKIRRSGDLDSILRTTAGELLRAMRASHAEVRLLLQPEQSLKMEVNDEHPGSMVGKSNPACGGTCHFAGTPPFPTDRQSGAPPRNLLCADQCRN
jgi:sigma-B regulation protein RsbU (phosphoserine phosphatase)